MLASSLGIATGWVASVRFHVEARDFLFSTASNPALGPTQSHVQWLPAVKRPRHEADHDYSPRYSVEFKNGGTVPTLTRMFSYQIPGTDRKLAREQSLRDICMSMRLVVLERRLGWFRG
jgi:hypothetical protein